MFITGRCRFIAFFLVVLFGFTQSQNTYAIDPRVKALGVMSAYGTIGGALLGTASLAFGSSGRSVARGASLGLYAGILFGTYIVASHAYKKRQLNNPQPEEAPYGRQEEEQSGGIFDGFQWGGWGGGFGAEEEGEINGGQGQDEEGYYDEEDGYYQRWNPYQELGQLRHSADFERQNSLKPSNARPVYFINLINYQF